MSCSNDDHEFGDILMCFNDTSLAGIVEEYRPISMTIKEGYVSQKCDTIRIIRNKEVIAVVILSEPKIIAQSLIEESWGHFQFPSIFRDEYNKNIIVTYSMGEDSYEAYGNPSSGILLSEDEGNTWEPHEDDFFGHGKYGVELKNGNILQVKTPAARDITAYTSFPKSVNPESIFGYDFYKESDLPEDLQGVYFEKWNKQTNEIIKIHASITDPGYLRYTINGLMPICWWGNIKEIEDGSLIAGVYPCNYQNSKGEVLRTSISFYRSIDQGQNWTIQGNIPYQESEKDNFEDYIFDNEGYYEPAFEILNNGDYICVMRTGPRDPMCISFSHDKGCTWTAPYKITPNGVFPSLLLLGNGILVLTSGRPGVQLRLNLDGDGLLWTEPIEMVPYMDKNDNYDIYASCGYTSVLPIDDNTFFLVYSDFKTKNSKGEERKAIILRRIEIIKKQ